eukprot:TRINITY_DN2158_c0_g1_i1.p2 TRINITY_DN2158_c0_g1~~TRINITY_DN2158_c0_g1_i1.p2  ORF type:complete len:160 (-),score=35.87 TRINITY_DN2158_c0_g1_i1:85-564(-)
MEGAGDLVNPTPHIFAVEGEGRLASGREWDDTVEEPFDSWEVFDLLRGIKDPEHPNTLEELRVVQHDLIHVDDAHCRIVMTFTPTIPHCSLATLIGLCIRVKLLRSLPQRFKVDVTITPGTHSSEDTINKQLNDKERVAAALENANLLGMVHECLRGAV